MRTRKVIEREPIEKRRATEGLSEDEIYEEYRDVFEAVAKMDQYNGRIIFNYAHGNQSIVCIVNVDAKADRLKKENQKIFFEQILSDEDPMYYDDFIETVSERVSEEVPELKYDILYGETGFTGRSGGHFQIHVKMPESFVEVKRYVDGFVSYDIWDVNYVVVMEYVEAINKLYTWIDKFILDYWNGLCEDIREHLIA